MIELLSLPRRRSRNISLPNINFHSGLPINSLPGWEEIPLNLKLPMLKCPGNHVIFSKNKIGQTLRQQKHSFDTSGQDSIPEYNPLHDSNLKTFYANERNLKRLRENGEITLDNDVICNLKDFNQYRQQLHKSQLYYILQEMNRLENEQHDRLLISTAEDITNRDHQNISARDISYSKIFRRKTFLDQQRAEHFQKLHEKTLEKLTRIQRIRTMNETAINYKKVLLQLKYQKYADARNDLQRKHLISLKKRFQFKKDRFLKNLRRLHETRVQEEEENQTESWNKRLAERIANQAKVNSLLSQANKKRRIFIENHMNKYQKKWDKIQQDIKKRSEKNRKCIVLDPKAGKLKEKSVNEPSKHSFTITEFKDKFEKLLDSEVCEALNTAVYLEDELKLPFEPTADIYRAAQYITQVILKNFKKNLSHDKQTFSNVYERIDKFFDDAKKFIIFRATQIIAHCESHSGSVQLDKCKRASVSFCYVANTIGVSSYEIHPLIEVKEVFNRIPTPVGSLASVIIDSTTSLVEKSNCSNLARNDLVFIEHYITKMKRTLIVGVGRRVFAAIQCHYENKTMAVKQELLDIDRKFLLHQLTKAILSYAINPLNFKSILKLCISALASDIVWTLQKQLLKPKPDCRRVAKPSIQCCCKDNPTLMSLFCECTEMSQTTTKNPCFHNLEPNTTEQFVDVKEHKPNIVKAWKRYLTSSHHSLLISIRRLI